MLRASVFIKFAKDAIEYEGRTGGDSESYSGGCGC